MKYYWVGSDYVREVDLTPVDPKHSVDTHGDIYDLRSSQLHKTYKSAVTDLLRRLRGQREHLMKLIIKWEAKLDE